MRAPNPRNWTAGELSALIQNYPTGGSNAVLPLLPGRTRVAIQRRARLLGLHIRKTGWTWTPWSSIEDGFIRQHYDGTKASLDRLRETMMPNRTLGSLRARVRRLGIGVYRRWTEDEKFDLESCWGAGLSLNRMAKRFKRTKLAIITQAKVLGLPMGCPDGFEYIKAAATRCGYANTATLRKILNWAGYKARRSLSMPQRGSVVVGDGHRRPHYIVDSEAVDDAVARWHQTETVEQAARDHGVAGITMREWLIKAGVIERKSDKTQVRVATADVERVVREHAADIAAKKQRSIARVTCKCGRARAAEADICRVCRFAIRKAAKRARYVCPICKGRKGYTAKMCRQCFADSRRTDVAQPIRRAA